MTYNFISIDHLQTKRKQVARKSVEKSGVYLIPEVALRARDKRKTSEILEQGPDPIHVLLLVWYKGYIAVVCKPTEPAAASCLSRSKVIYSTNAD